MQIDWITVTAQIVNFLVLAWLLHRFLYGPITRAMERREQRITQRLGDAERKRAEAEKEADAFRQKQAELQNQCEQFLADAEKDAEQERRRLHQDARDEIAALKQGWLNDLNRQRDEFLRDIGQRTQEHFYLLARRALGDLADVRLEEQMSHVFQSKLAALDRATKTKIADGGRKDGNNATVRSGFDLSSAVKHKITKTIHDEFLEDAAVTYERKPDVICGFEFVMGGQTVSWNIDGYVETLEKLIEQDIGERSVHTD